MVRAGQVRLVVLLSFTSVLLLGLGHSQASGEQAYSASDLKRGGLLYDNWPKLTGFSSGENHPLYPPDGKKAGTTTWRCKECHGWDYRGDQGRYRSGSHYTGIKGLLEAQDLSPKELYEKLSSSRSSHDFGTRLSDTDLWALVGFLREGLLDTVASVLESGSVVGDPSEGARHYQDQCANCHGKDGNRMDFKGKKEGVQGVGWLSRKNPQETLHKIRWGHPGSDMPSATVDFGLEDAAAIDLLAFTASLP